jgi:hypothetical protein
MKDDVFSAYARPNSPAKMFIRVKNIGWGKRARRGVTIPSRFSRERSDTRLRLDAGSVIRQ